MRFCQSRHVDPYTASPEIVCNFLAHVRRERLAHLGKQSAYQTVCGFRSAIAKYHLGNGGVSISEHPLIKALVKGVFNEAPPLAKYTQTWSIDKLLDHLSTFCADLSLKQIQQKTLALLVVSGCLRYTRLSLDPPIHITVLYSYIGKM